MSTDALPEKKPAPRNRQTLFPEQIRAINGTLPPRLQCAVLHSGRGKAVIFVERPRNTRRPPRRGVQIPLPPLAQKGLAKVSKHWRQQSRFKDSFERPAKPMAPAGEAR